MPNYKRIIPRTPIEPTYGIVRMYTDANGDLVVEYAGGDIEVIDLNAAPGIIILDGEFAPNTQTQDHDGGDSDTPGTVVINAGGA